MKKSVLTILVLLLSILNSTAQTVVSKDIRIKNTLITYNVYGNDTIYHYPVIDFSDAIRPTIILRFNGIDALVGTLTYLSSVEFDDGTIVKLDSAVEHNEVSMVSDLFTKRFMIHNVGDYLPRYVSVSRDYFKRDLAKVKRYLNKKK